MKEGIKEEEKRITESKINKVKEVFMNEIKCLKDQLFQ